jgi:hypothetical protein
VQIHAAPDSNVRPAGSRAPREPAPTPFRRVARSLLSSRVVGVLLLAVASSMSACIIPVAPNFQDPPSQPDSVPYLQTVFPTPIFNSIFTLQVPTATYEVYVSDPDPGVATLYYQWVFDYPPVGATAPRLANSGMNSPPFKLDQDVSCKRVDATTPSTTHRLELFVATGSFDSSAATYGTTVDPNAFVVSGGWTIQFQMACGQ